MAQDLLFPGNILSLHRAAVDKLARQGDGDAALLYLVLAAGGTSGALPWGPEKVEGAKNTLIQLGLLPSDAAVLPPVPQKLEDDRPPEYTSQDIAQALQDRKGFRDLVPAVIAGLMVLPVVWENVTQGLRATDGQLLELARAYRFSRWKTVRLVYLPSLRPHLRSAAATAMGLAWKSGVAAEVLCLPRLGIGAQISRAKQTFETADLFAWTAVVILLSLLMERALTRLIRRPEGGKPL